MRDPDRKNPKRPPARRPRGSAPQSTRCAQGLYIALSDDEAWRLSRAAHVAGVGRVELVRREMHRRVLELLGPPEARDTLSPREEP